MNEKEKIALLLSALIDNKDDTQNGLSVNMINEFIKNAQLEMSEINHDIVPIRALFNLIVALDYKIETLTQELNFMKKFNANFTVNEK